MGAALTYARRYALFALVGIAGEDDLDAPDLTVANEPVSGGAREGNGQWKPRQQLPEHAKTSRRRRQTAQEPKPPLQTELSAVLRIQLLEELTAIGSVDEGVAWAQQRLAAKNTLTVPDADLVEQAFRKKMSSFEVPGGAAPTQVRGGAQSEHSEGDGSQKSGLQGELPRGKTMSSLLEHVPALDGKSDLPFLKLVRKRDKVHRQFVCSQPCLICGRRPSDAHHLRFAQARALGTWVSDEFIVPLCRVHHRDLHRRGDEKKWWEAVSIDPMEVAQGLWRETRRSGV
jgi:ERF superfamily